MQCQGGRGLRMDHYLISGGEMEEKGYAEENSIQERMLNLKGRASGKDEPNRRGRGGSSFGVSTGEHTPGTRSPLEQATSKPAEEIWSTGMQG